MTITPRDFSAERFSSMSDGRVRLPDPSCCEDLLKTASFWYDRWRSGLLNPGEAEGFRRWLDLDVSHRRAFESVASLVGAFASPVTI